MTRGNITEFVKDVTYTLLLCFSNFIAKMADVIDESNRQVLQM